MSEIEAIAETTGKAIDASRDLGGFLKRFLIGPMDQISGMVQDHFKVVRWERQVRLMERTNTFMKARGLERATRQIP